jgi:SAM-dependent methyltransferase
VLNAVSCPMTDDAFDALAPAPLRHLSAVHWTPVAVAVRAVRWLAPQPSMRILDVGCGIGKLCTIGARWTGGDWYGVEQHRQLVAAAIDVSSALGLSRRTCFVHGDALSLDWEPFHSFYFYNPFEMLLSSTEPPDKHERRRRHRAQVEAVQTRLESLRPGTRVVTYHGLGGEMPPSYELVRQAHVQLGDLELWRRRAPSRRRAAEAAR